MYKRQVKGGGCAGFEYEWSFADEETRNDVIVDDILLIDRINELYLTGMELDYKKEIWVVTLNLKTLWLNHHVVVVLVFLFNDSK